MWSSATSTVSLADLLAQETIVTVESILMMYMIPDGKGLDTQMFSSPQMEINSGIFVDLGIGMNIDLLKHSGAEK